MKDIKTYRGENVLVLGLGKSGFAISELLLKLGAKITLNDKQDLTDNEHAQKLEKMGVRIIGGHHPVDLLEEEHFDFFVKNPGIPYENPMVQKASELKIPIITEPEIALSASEAPFVCVTGSNGKTTTVMLTSEIIDHHLTKSGHHAYAVGNIGVPISEVVQKTTKDDVLVVEISNFQLLGVTDIKPKVAAIVDIYPTHLDYHRTMENYIAAKLNVTRFQTCDEYFIANFDQKEILSKKEATTKTKIQTFSMNDHSASYFVGDEYLESQSEKIMKISDVKLPGRHNLQNNMVTIAISKLVEAENSDIQAVLSTFAGTGHRLQYVTTISDMKIYNNSKSTNIEAATVTIKAFSEPEVLIGSGLDHGFTFDSLVPLLKKHVKAVVLYGETRYLLADAARKADIKKIKIVNTLKEAVPVAYELTKPDDVLLLSPACASWSQFKAFEQRGDYFMEYIKELN